MTQLSASETLNFFKSVIMCGEGWTRTCQEAFESAKSRIDWQPISTAPERTDILAVENFQRTDDQGRRHPCEYQVVRKIDGNWIAYGIHLASFEPTHWKPLDPAPSCHASAGDTE